MDTIVAGALAAFTVDMLIYPLDTIKTRLQAPDVKERFPTRASFYSGLYRGVGVVVIATLPAAGVFFTVYEGSKTSLAPVLSGPALHLASSAIGELASCAVITPAEIIKQRAQVASAASAAKTAQAAAASSSSSSSSSSYTGQGKPFVNAANQVTSNAADAVKGKQTPRTAVREAAAGVAQTAVNQTTAGQTAKQVVREVPSVSKTFVRGYLALTGRNLPVTAIQMPLYEGFREYFSKRFNVRLGSDTDSGDLLLHQQGDGDGTASGSWGGSDTSNENGPSLVQRATSSTLTSLGLSPSPRKSQSTREEIIDPGLVAGASAALAGSTAALITTPIDNAKTRIMIGADTSGPSSPSSSSGGANANTVRTDLGTIRTISEIYTKEGFKSLWRGGALRSAWTALGAGVYLGSYESGRLWFARRRKRKAEEGAGGGETSRG